MTMNTDQLKAAMKALEAANRAYSNYETKASARLIELNNARAEAQATVVAIANGTYVAPVAEDAAADSEVAAADAQASA